METIIYVYLFIFGTLFGSFASVIIDRIRNKKSGIIDGRSECPKCKHKLGPVDLVPIFSYISTGGKCRYCKKKISPLYPLLEITTGLIFMATVYFLVNIPLLLLGSTLEIYKLIFFCLLSFLTVVYIFYDILYLEIPDRILALLIIGTLLSLGIQSYSENFQIFSFLKNNITLNTEQNTILLLTLVGMIGGLYFIMLKGLKEIYDVVILIVLGIIIYFIQYCLQISLTDTILGQAILGSIVIFSFLFLQIFISGGAWMGGGDLRIAILMGMIVGFHFSFASVMVSYFSGSILGIVLIMYTKVKNYYENQKNLLVRIRKILGFSQKNSALDTKIPFGPFLALGIYIILFLNDFINTLITKYL